MAAIPRDIPLATIIRREITSYSAGLNEIMAGAGEPLMRFAALYLAIATGIPALKVDAVYAFCQSVLIVVPEFILLGALDIAGQACKTEQKIWGRLLYMVCLALTVVMVLTFIDIFVSTFSQDQIKDLNFARCLIAVSFSILLSKLHKIEPPKPTVDPAVVTQLQQQHQDAQAKIAELEQIAQSSQQQAQTTITQLEQSAQSAHQVAQSSQEELARQVAETQQLQAKMADLEVKLTTFQSSPVDMIVDKKAQRTGNKSVNQDDNQLSEIVDISVYKKAQPSGNKPVNKLGNKSATTMETNASTNLGRGEARQKALSLLKRHPELTSGELAKKAGITRQYASKLISEQQQKVVNE